MTTPPDRVESLDPHPRAIVDFIQAVTEQAWPSAHDQIRTYFEHLGCDLESAEEHDDDAPGVTCGAFVTRRITTKNASWIALDGALFSLNFFVYESERDVAAAVDAGYDGVRTGLVRLYGPPLDERISRRDNRSAVWLVQDTEIELYGHTSLAPVLQIGLGHKERDAVYEHRLAQSPDRPTA